MSGDPVNEANYGRWTSDWGLAFEDDQDADSFIEHADEQLGRREREKHLRKYGPKMVACATRDWQRWAIEHATRLDMEFEPNIDEPHERRFRHAEHKKHVNNVLGTIGELEQDLGESHSARLIGESVADDYLKERFRLWLRMARKRRAMTGRPDKDVRPVIIRGLKAFCSGGYYKVQAMSAMSGTITGGSRKPDFVLFRPLIDPEPDLPRSVVYNQLLTSKLRRGQNSVRSLKALHKAYKIMTEVIREENAVDPQTGSLVGIWFSGGTFSDLEKRQIKLGRFDSSVADTPTTAVDLAFKLGRRVPELEPLILKGEIYLAKTYRSHFKFDWPELDRKIETEALRKNLPKLKNLQTELEADLGEET